MCPSELRAGTTSAAETWALPGGNPGRTSHQSTFLPHCLSSGLSSGPWGQKPADKGKCSLQSPSPGVTWWRVEGRFGAETIPSNGHSPRPIQPWVCAS